MQVRLHALLVFLITVFFVATVQSAEENGIQYDVQKRVLDKADMRGADVNISHLDRLMGLKVALKNVSFNDLPAGEIRWEILNRKALSTNIELTSGKTPMPMIKRGQKINLMIGEAKVQGYRDGAVRHVDELEWQITIVSSGKEQLKVNSTKSFNMLAKRATKVELPAGEPAK